MARAARPGHFLMVRIDETGERIPLTVADYDVERTHIENEDNHLFPLAER